MEKSNNKKQVIEEEKKASPSNTVIVVEKLKPKQKVICFYRERDEYGFCSNFFKSPVHIDGKTWPTTEHYFQAMKFPTMPES